MLEGETLRLSFADTFSENLLRREGGEVLQLLWEVSGIQARLEVQLTQAQNQVEESLSPEDDDQVALVQKVFRGEIIQGGSV